MNAQSAQQVEVEPGPWRPDMVPAGRVVPVWTYGDKLRKVRRQAGLTQQAFADVLRVGKGSLQAWEADQRRPGYQQVMLMAMMIEDRYGIPVDWFMADDDRATPESLDFARRNGARIRHARVTGGDRLYLDEAELREAQENPRRDDGGSDAVRHVGLEPTTR